jgi:leader peptidase (prepilin peptidase) / N-methyltransferase
MPPPAASRHCADLRSATLTMRQQTTDLPAGRARTAPAFLGRSPMGFVGLPAAALFAGVPLLIADDRIIVGAAFGLMMMSIAAVDARHYIIPDRLIFGALILGGLYATAATPGGFEIPLFDAALRAAATAALFLLLQIAYRWLRGREGMGFGDVKLAAVAGVWLDWPTIPLAIEIAAGAGLACYLTVGAMARRPIRLTSKLPFGLFFAPAIWLAWVIQSLMA